MNDWYDPLSPDGRPFSAALPSDSGQFPEVSGMPSPESFSEIEVGKTRRRKIYLLAALIGVVASSAVTVSVIGLHGGGSLTTLGAQSSTPIPARLPATEELPPSTSQSGITAITTLTPSSKAVPALSLLSLIVVANEFENGYDRELFGYPGIEDGAGCDTRDRVLKDESLGVAQIAYPGCQVIEGDWISLYDLVEITDPAELEVDHVVALKEAWDSGAWEWSSETLVAFGNDTVDHRTLRAVTASTNQSKLDKDPSNWMPPARSVWCQYLADWVAIKARWALTMDPSEYGRIKRLLQSECADTYIEPSEPVQIVFMRLLDSDPNLDPDSDSNVVAIPVPVPYGGKTDVSVYYANCAAARAAGVAPLYTGDLGYREALDRDRDGVACE